MKGAIILFMQILRCIIRFHRLASRNLAKNYVRKNISKLSVDPLEFTSSAIFSISKSCYLVKTDVHSNGDVTNNCISCFTFRPLYIQVQIKLHSNVFLQEQKNSELKEISQTIC